MLEVGPPTWSEHDGHRGGERVEHPLTFPHPKRVGGQFGVLPLPVAPMRLCTSASDFWPVGTDGWAGPSRNNWFGSGGTICTAACSPLVAQSRPPRGGPTKTRSAAETFRSVDARRRRTRPILGRRPSGRSGVPRTRPRDDGRNHPAKAPETRAHHSVANPMPARLNERSARSASS